MSNDYINYLMMSYKGNFKFRVPMEQYSKLSREEEYALHAAMETFVKAYPKGAICFSPYISRTIPYEASFNQYTIYITDVDGFIEDYMKTAMKGEAAEKAAKMPTPQALREFLQEEREGN